MAKKLLLILCTLTLPMGAGQAAAFIQLDSATEISQQGEKPELKSLIGAGVWWGKSETLERNMSQTDMEADNGGGKI